MLKKLNNQSGSVIIEYTIVFPVILFIIFLIFFTGYIMHQKATIESAAQRGALICSKMITDPYYASIANYSFDNGVKDRIDTHGITISKSTFSEVNPYRYILDTGGTSAKVKNDTEELISEYIKKTNLVIETIPEISCTPKLTNPFYQTVEVNISQSYKIPIKFGSVNFPTLVHFESSAITVVNDPDEFIRNADLAAYYVNEVGNTAVGTKIKGVFSKVTSVITDFFK